MKKKLALLMALMIFGNMAVSATEEEEKSVKVSFNGAEMEIVGQQPVIEDGRTLVPMRAIFENLNATVEWDNDTRTVTAKNGETEIILPIGSDVYKVNGEEKQAEVPAKIINDRTMVPLGVVCDSFGYYVAWLPEKYQVAISTIEYAEIVNETDRIRAIEPTIDSSYKTVDGVRLPIKMYISDDEEKGNTCVLAIHGGSWYAVKEDSDTWNGSWMNYQAQYYADKGYTSAAISYRDIRLTEETDVFDLIEDCKDAVKFMREQKDFDKLIIMGDSSGGHLAVELGLDDEIGADIIVAANPVLDLTNEKWKHTAKTEEDYKKASPSFNTKKTATKFLVMHGNADVLVDYKISEKFCEDMTALGTQCDMIVLDGVNHAFILSRYQSTDEKINEYMTMIDEYIEKNI